MIRLFVIQKKNVYNLYFDILFLNIIEFNENHIFNKIFNMLNI